MAFHRICKLWWQKSLVLSLMTTSLVAQSSAASINANESQTQKSSVDRITRFEGSLPTGLELILSEASEKSSSGTRFLPGDESKLVFFLDGNFQGSFSEDDSIENLLQGAVAATFQIQVSALSVEARINLQNEINQMLEDDHRARGSVQSNGVADIADPLFLEKLIASVAILEVPSDQRDGEGNQVALFYLKAGAGRGEIYAAKIMPWQRAMDLFGQERITQTEQVFVEASLLSKLFVRVAAFGFDWDLGNSVDESNRPELANVERDGEGSWSISMAYDASKLVEKIGGQLEFSVLFADVKEGFFNPNRPVGQQVDDYRLYALRGDYQVDKLSISLEGFYRDPNDSSEDSEWGVVAQVGYQLTDRVHLVGELGHIDFADGSEANTIGGGLTFAIYNNVKAYAMLRYDLESEEAIAWVGMAIEGAVYDINKGRVRHIAMAEYIGRSE